MSSYLGLDRPPPGRRGNGKGVNRRIACPSKLSLDLDGQLQCHEKRNFENFLAQNSVPSLLDQRDKDQGKPGAGGGKGDEGTLCGILRRQVKRQDHSHVDRTDWPVELASFTQPRTVNKETGLREAMFNTDFSDDYVNKQIVAMYFLVTHMNFVINEDLMVGQNLGFKWINRHNSM